MSEKLVRMSFTVPPKVRDDLSYLSMRLGVSKSSVLSTILSAPLSDIVEMLSSIPADIRDEDAPDHARRFRDSSVHYIERKSAEVLDLFKGLE